ncbi:succinate dehydrogenase/fumarate reductase flavoprotein [Aspergillus karnatakaensis]|uniref:succinate dehydrogenase/fumarate reductase flavoprotein n=1 Tax=Aspergillus karnatakaensis TaxID=1810916 RepID=UPI003CCDD494
MAALWDVVYRARDIAVFHQAPVADLIVEGDTVTGVVVRLHRAAVRVQGQVILGCGGFQASPRLRRQYLGEGWDLVALRGTRFNTGTMMEKAVAAGAGAVGHFGGCHATPHDLNAAKILTPADADRMSRYSFPYSVMVNAEGRRFMDEGENVFSLTYAKTGAAIVKQPHAIAFQVFDQKTIHLLEPRYCTASPIEADTIEELAVKIGVDAVVLAATIREYNDGTPTDATSRFAPFSLDGVSTSPSLAIPKSNWALPIDTPPFVAYGATCGITFTYGGLKVDEGARVLNNEGVAMPGLWAVGEIAGGFFAFNYPGGSGLTKGAVFGKIAGEAAARRARESSIE